MNPRLLLAVCVVLTMVQNAEPGLLPQVTTGTCVSLTILVRNCRQVDDHEECYWGSPPATCSFEIKYPDNYTFPDAVAFCKKTVIRREGEDSWKVKSCEKDPTLGNGWISPMHKELL
jgi:hypothetical protein